MRKTLKLLTLTGVAYLIAWTSTSAQLQGIPDGLPVNADDYLGDNQYSSDLLGDFELDTSNDNRFIHTILGPLVWEWDEATEMVILHTEWWGDLYTHLPTVSEENKHASGLGFTWPLVKSEITGAIYEVNVKADPNDPESTPFYNHREVNGEKIGWQHSIGVDLSSAANYYAAAETIVGQMESVLNNMVQLQQEYVELAVSLEAGQGPIDEKFEQLRAQFLSMHDAWVKFNFYYHRCSLASVWAEKQSLSDADIILAQAYANQLPGLESAAVAIYGNGQQILYVNGTQLKDAKTNALNVLIAEEAARQAAAAAAKAASSSSHGSSSSSSSSSTKFSGSGSMFDGVDVTTLVEDSLLGDTEANAMYGGEITSTGYRSKGGKNHLLYRLGEIREGYVEFQISGLDHDDFDGGNSAFCMIYDGTGQREPIPYVGGFRNNRFRLAMKYRQNKQALKAKIITVGEERRSTSNAFLSGSELENEHLVWKYEPTGDGINFNDRSRWYTMRFEWKDKNFRWLVNNDVVWEGNGPYDYAPVQTRVRLGGGDGFHLQTSPNIKYRNLKVCKYK